MGTGSLTAHRTPLQAGDGQRERGEAGTRVLFPFGDLQTNAAQERQIFESQWTMSPRSVRFLFPPAYTLDAGGEEEERESRRYKGESLHLRHY